MAVLYPERCACCGEVILCGQLWCERCNQDLPLIRPPICPCCGLPADHCSCHQKQHYYERCVGAFLYEGTAKQGILRLKSLYKEESAEAFAFALSIVIRREYGNIPFDCITYVPVSKKVRRDRGFNQCELLARFLSTYTRIPLQELLVKTVDTEPQKNLSAMERSGNVLGVFDVKNDFSPKGKTILLLDDIMTTGATLNECAKMLTIAGAQAVYAVAATITSVANTAET